MILVTGASGFIGRSLTWRLAQGQRPFRAYSGRMNDPMALRAALPDVETVIHLAGSEARGRVRLLHHVDVEGTERLMEECLRQNARLIAVSRLGADPDSMFPLLRAKGEVERLVRRSGLAFTIMRSASLFGRGDRFLNTIARLARRSWPFVWVPAGGHNPMQPLWVEDFARCLEALLDRPDLTGATLEVAGEERLRYHQIVEEVLFASGLRRLAIRPGPRLTRPLASLCFGWQRRPAVSRFFLDRLAVPDVADVDSVIRTFGFRPGRLSQHIAFLRRGGR